MKNKIFLFCLMIFFAFTVISPSLLAEQSQEDKDDEGSSMDIGNIKGSIIEITGEEDEAIIKIDAGFEDGIDVEKEIGSMFTVIRKGVPVAVLEVTQPGEKESICKIDDLLDGIKLENGEKVESGEIDLEQGDIVFLDSPGYELLSKTELFGHWDFAPVNSDLLGDAHILTIYEHDDTASDIVASQGFFGKIIASFVGSDDDSYMFFFDEYGDKNWGYEVDMCLFDLIRNKPDYKVFGDKVFFNTYNIQKDHITGGYRETSGVLFGLNLETGEELWRLKDEVTGYDPVLYSLVYDNFIDKVCYLYSDKASLYAVDLLTGKFIWEFVMHSQGVAEGYFSERDGFLYAADKDGYFYKVKSQDGTEVWAFKAEAPIIKINYPKIDSSTVFLFDSKKSIYALNEESGTCLWTYTAAENFENPYKNQLMGDMIFVYEKDSIAAVSKDKGSKIWSYKILDPYPLYYEDNILYCLSGYKNLQVIDINRGNLLWAYNGKEDIYRVIPMKDALYILDDHNIYARSKSDGQEFWHKDKLEEPAYLPKVKAKPKDDPYSIEEIGKDNSGDDLFFLADKHHYFVIDSLTHDILVEQPMTLLNINKDTLEDLEDKISAEKLNLLKDFMDGSIYIYKDTIDDLEGELSSEKIDIIMKLMNVRFEVTYKTIEEVSDDLSLEKLDIIKTFINLKLSKEDMNAKLTESGFSAEEIENIWDDIQISYDPLTLKELTAGLTSSGFTPEELEVFFDESVLLYDRYVEKDLISKLSGLGFNEEEIDRILKEIEPVDDRFIRAVSDQDMFYMVSEKHIWALDSKSGMVKWERDFEANVHYMTTPPQGILSYSNAFLVKGALDSKSEHFLGLIVSHNEVLGPDDCDAGSAAGWFSGLFNPFGGRTPEDMIYILDKKTGAVISRTEKDASVYPYLELECMKKTGEEMKDLYFYSNDDAFYSIRVR